MTMHNEQHDSPWDLLSEILSKDTGLETARLLDFAGLIGAGDSLADKAPRAAKDGPKAIGPWLPSTEDGQLAFVREPMQGHDFIWWRPSFEREVLKPRAEGDPCRVCVIGESAAAGMFYTPHFTPTLALGQHLAMGSGSAEAFEVLDLTRNSMNAAELVGVTSAALQLRPNYLVIFAGNNWFAGQGYRWEGGSQERAAYAESIAEQGMAGVVRTFQDRVRDVAARTLAQLGALVEGTGTKIIFVVPAVNPSWERAEPVLWLGEGRTPRWFEHHAAATHALAHANFEKALTEANAMLELDAGTCSTSHCIKGKALVGLGRAEEAAAAFDAELDHANAFENFCQTIPGAPAYVREQIRQSAAKVDIACVDLPAVFTEHTRSPVEWSPLFVDYCHLTPMGMNVAMAAVANQVLDREVTEKDGNDWKSLVGRAELHVDDRVEAIARFYTALYAAHFENTLLPVNGAKIAARIKSACELSPSIVPFITDYVRARNGAVMSCNLLAGASQRVIHQSNNPFMDYAAVRGAGGVDAVAIQAIGAALDAVGAPGKETVAEYLDYYQRELEKGVDLTEPVYVEAMGASVPWLKYESERETRRALPFFRAIWPSSAFTLVGGSGRDVDLKIVARVPGLTDDARAMVRVSINGVPVDELPTCKTWTMHKLSIPASKLRDGANRLTVEWPGLATNEARAWNEAQRRYRVGQRPDIFPIFGEIFSCLARTR